MTKNITLASLAKTLKIAPKALRRRLRSLPSVPYVKNSKRWEFTPANAKKVAAMIKTA